MPLTNFYTYLVTLIMNMYQLHGLLQVIAFGVLFPLGALIALFRDSVGDSWRKYHVIIQLAATIMVFAAVTVVHMGDPKDRPKMDASALKYHKIIGPTVVLLIVAQLLWAFKGRDLVEYVTWLNIHMVLSASIITLGLTNIYLGWKMTKHNVMVE